MKILRNYILKDFFSISIFSFLTLTMIMLIGKIFTITDMIVRKGISIRDTLSVISSFIPYLLGITIPVAFLLGVLLVMGKLIADNELIAIKVAGISVTQILNIFLCIGVILSLFLFILHSKIIPEAHYRSKSQLKNTLIKNAAALIEPRVFLENFENYIIYVSDKDGSKLKNVFIYEVNESNDNSVSKVTFAKEGEFVFENKTLKIGLKDGFMDETSQDNNQELYRLNFKTFFMDIPLKTNKPLKINKKSKDLTFQELRKKISKLKKMGVDPFELNTEFHKRISLSFSVISFALLGIGASFVVRHREKTINFGIAIVGGLGYYLLFILGEALIEYHYINPFLGMWLPNIIIISLGSFLFIKNAHSR